jgi:DNA-binding transcriptional LysR family regulator
LILPSRALHPDTVHQLELRFLQEGSTLNVTCELETSLAMINFVAMGIGCSILPNYVRSIGQEGVVYKPLADPNLDKTLAILKKRGRTDLAELFFNFAREHFVGPVKLKAPQLDGALAPREQDGDIEINGAEGSGRSGMLSRP